MAKSRVSNSLFTEPTNVIVLSRIVVPASLDLRLAHEADEHDISDGTLTDRWSISECNPQIDSRQQYGV